MVGMILPLQLWLRMPSLDKPLQPLSRQLTLHSNSLPLPQCNSLLHPLLGEVSSLSNSKGDSNSHHSSNKSSMLLLPTNHQDGEDFSLHSSSLPRVPLPITSRRHLLNLPNPQLPFPPSIKSSKMSWRASDQNVNKVS